MKENSEIDKLIEGYQILQDMKSFDKEKAKRKFFASVVNKQNRILGKVSRIAAFIILPIIASLITYITVNKRNFSVANNSEVTITAPQFGVLTYQLPDSSKVWLSNGSSITYNAGMATAKRRTINMNGEAYFDVTKDANRPFEVNISDIKIEVKGTQFNCIEKGSVVEVTLIEGSVLVKDKCGKISQTMLPNQQLIYNNSGEHVINKGIDCRPYTMWRDNELFFNNTSLDLVLERLGRFYNVDIQYNNIKSDKKIYANFKNENLEDVLGIVTSIFDISYSIDNNNGHKVVTFLKK